MTKMTNEPTDISELFPELELVFALPDHKTPRPDRRPVVTNFRPDYFVPDEYDQLVTKAETVETRLGTYRKRYDFPIASRDIGTVIYGADGSMIPSLGARVVIYERV